MRKWSPNGSKKLQNETKMGAKWTLNTAKLGAQRHEKSIWLLKRKNQLNASRLTFSWFFHNNYHIDFSCLRAPNLAVFWIHLAPIFASFWGSQLPSGLDLEGCCPHFGAKLVLSWGTLPHWLDLYSPKSTKR